MTIVVIIIILWVNYRSELEKRLEQSRQKQQQAERDLENWRQELVKYNQWVGYVASVYPLLFGSCPSVCLSVCPFRTVVQRKNN